jgi:aminopeptidase
MDPRVTKLARLLVHYSVNLKKGQLVKIQGEMAALPLIEAIFAEAVDVGAHPYTDIIIPATQEIFLKKASRAQLEHVSPLARHEVQKIDALVAIWASQNTRFLAGVEPKRQATAHKARRPIIDRLFARMGTGEISWVGTQFPTHADAQEASMSLADFEEFVYGAGHINSPDPVKHWRKVAREQTRLKRILDRVDRLHVRSADADLKLRVKGRKWISCHGTENFPDGEIFTGPVEDSAEGWIRFSYPAVYRGRDVEDVRLEFKKGKVVAESAGRNLDYLQAMLGMDPGARRVGEFAIGTNYEIKRFTRNILFDEKIGGTCHLAVGASIPESGGKNKSALHWDMICDLKRDAEIVADGKVIYRNGKFTI